MRNKKTTFALALATVAVGASLFVSQASASSSWKEYFSENEADSLKKYVAEYIREQMKNNNKDWKGIISAKELDNGTINADKVDNSVTKRKIYTGIAPTSSVGSNYEYVTNDADDSKYYYIKISAPEIKIENNPQVSLYTKTGDNFPESGLWENGDSEVLFKDGIIWIRYGQSDEDGWVQYINEYKIVVNY